jgi:hypothetical protein
MLLQFGQTTDGSRQLGRFEGDSGALRRRRRRLSRQATRTLMMTPPVNAYFTAPGEEIDRT